MSLAADTARTASNMNLALAMHYTIRVLEGASEHVSSKTLLEVINEKLSALERERLRLLEDERLKAEANTQLAEVLKDGITIHEKYGPAMLITQQREADLYFEQCVEHCMKFGNTREQAEEIERQNLAYFAGYYGPHVRARVENFFRCAHPLLGAIAERGEPTPEEAFNAGKKFGEQLRKEKR